MRRFAIGSPNSRQHRLKVCVVTAAAKLVVTHTSTTPHCDRYESVESRLIGSHYRCDLRLHLLARALTDPPFVIQIITDQLIWVPKTSKERACDDCLTEIGTWSFATPGRQSAIQERHIVKGDSEKGADCQLSHYQNKFAQSPFAIALVRTPFGGTFLI